MRTSLRPFPEYRDSGLPWLGQIPAHWQVRRNGYLFAQRNETGHGDLPVLEVSIKSGVSVRSFDGSARKQVMSDREKYKRAARGDIAYNMMRLWQGAIGVAPTDGLVSPAYVVAKPYPSALSHYFVELFRTDACKAEINKYSRGIVSDRNRLYWDEFKQMPICVPPAEEQAAIVRFLEHADQRIRRFIQAKRRVFKLIEEQKRTIIERFVTRGLDPSIPFRKSEADWLGDVPSHWTVSSLRFRYDQCLGKMVDAKKATGKHLIPYLRNVDVRWDSINTRDLPLIDITPQERGRFTVKHGDLLVCEGRHLGRCAFWDGQIDVCGFQKALHRLRPLNISTDNPRFLFYCLYLAHIKDAFDASSTDNSIPHLTGEMLRAHRFPFPPLDEQTAIASYLDNRLMAIKNALATIQETISLALEYRTKLIADVVTGKLDVREAAARSPSSAEQAATDDESFDLAILDPDEADGLDDDPELLPIVADEE